MTAVVVISQSVFALVHIPCRILDCFPLSEPPLDLLCLVGFGTFFALIYYRTNNLFIATGVHSLICTPAALLTTQETGSWLVICFSAVLIVTWPLARQICARRARGMDA